MRYILLILSFSLLVFSCKNNTSSPDPKVEKSEDIGVKFKKNIHQEYYPSGKLKISGKLDKQGLKKGIWTAYFENGQKMSESNYKNGVNNGYSIVWYPNGNVRYFGDYFEGEKKGEWTFYNEDGKVINTEKY